MNPLFFVIHFAFTIVIAILLSDNLVGLAIGMVAVSLIATAAYLKGILDGMNL